MLNDTNNHDMYNTYFVLFLYYLCLIGGLCLFIFYNRKFEDRNKIALIIIYPIAVNFIIVICGYDNVGTLMVYSQVFVWVLFISLLEKFNDTFYIKWFGKILLIIVIIYFARYDNICYLKAYQMQNQAISYFNQLKYDIYDSGCKEDSKVVFLNSEHKREIVKTDYQYDIVNINPYAKTSLINDYAWYEFMKYWCGVDFIREEDTSYYDDWSTRMPRYPENGSIIKDNNTIIVNF